jgi:hypothetical protein
MKKDKLVSGCCLMESHRKLARELGGAGGYKDFAPDGAAETSALFELLEEGIINFKDFSASKPQLF